VTQHERVTLDLNRIRSVQELLQTAIRLYARYPLQFILLAACVVVPYEVLIQVFTGASPLSRGHLSTQTLLILDLIAFDLIGPLVSALQVQALFAVSDGDHPGLGIVSERALRVAPTVVAAAIVATLGEGLGLVLFVIPGVYLLLRWAVVAPVAAAESVDWMGALRRSGELARFNYLRILGVLLVVGVTTLLVSNVAASIFGNSTKPGPVAIEVVVQVLIQAFTSLVTALLYFDLYSRETAGQ
jgi:hypothetical protein